MGARNSEHSFGWVTRALHWVTAVLVLAALPLGVWISEMEISLTAIKYFGIHKTLGISVLCLIVLRAIWHRMNPPPAPLSHGVVWQDRLAVAVHRAFYVLLFAMPLSGWIASSATGIDTVIFNRWTLPRIAPVSEVWEAVGFAAHGLIGKVLILVVALHMGGALYRAFVKRDGTLRRMVSG